MLNNQSHSNLILSSLRYHNVSMLHGGLYVLLESLQGEETSSHHVIHKQLQPCMHRHTRIHNDIQRGIMDKRLLTGLTNLLYSLRTPSNSLPLSVMSLLNLSKPPYILNLHMLSSSMHILTF